MPWDDWAWNRIVKSGANAGLAACQLHGMGRPDPDAPSMLDFEGLVLRAQLDGAVVRREVYWRAGMDVPLETAAAGMQDESLIPLNPPPDAAKRILFTSDFPWALFMDETLD